MPRHLLVLITALLLGDSVFASEALQAGAAVVDVTPPTGFPMWGYGARHDKPSDGMLDPLKAKALVLAVGAQKIALVGLDIGRAPTRGSMAAIRARIKETAGIEHVFIVGSHTHHGPVIELDNWPTPRTSYVRQLEQKLADVIIEADKNKKPAKLGIGSRQPNIEAKEHVYNRNRHSRRNDKEVDPELLVLRVEGLDGKPIAHAVNFAAHPTMHPAQVMKFSADYPGAMMDVVEQTTGAPCLFLQGACGDLSPNPPPNQGGPIKFGQALGREVLALVESIKCSDLKNNTLRVKQDEFQFKNRIDLSNRLIRVGVERAFFPELVAAFEREYQQGVRPHMTTALLDGRIGFVGVSGEFFCGHSLGLKRRARLEHVFFLGYCNDYHQYFPTIERASEGGYGTEPGVSNVEIGAGELMMNRALTHLYKMRGKFPSLPPEKESGK